MRHIISGNYNGFMYIKRQNIIIQTSLTYNFLIIMDLNMLRVFNIAEFVRDDTHQNSRE